MVKQLFIKDWKNTSDAEVRNRYGRTAGYIGIAVNLALGLVKLFVGSVTHSVSVVADAVNNLSDMASSVLTIVGFRLAAKKPDNEHPYGHARYEYVCGFVIAFLMLEMGVLFAKESVEKIINPQELSIDSTTYILLTIAMAGKIFLKHIYSDFASAIGSGTLEASATDTRNDIVSSGAILASMVFMGIFKINIDGYLALAVSIFVIISAFITLREELEPIIGIVPTHEQIKEISDKLGSYSCVLGIHDLVIHNYGVHNDFASVHVEIDSSMNILDAHEMIDDIERDFKRDLGIDMTIHMDPVVLGDSKTDSLKKSVETALKELDSTIKFHDFRVVTGKGHTNIVFDCVIPRDSNIKDDDVKRYLEERISSPDVGKLFFVIQFDAAYC